MASYLTGEDSGKVIYASWNALPPTEVKTTSIQITYGSSFINKTNSTFRSTNNLTQIYTSQTYCSFSLAVVLQAWLTQSHVPSSTTCQKISHSTQRFSNPNN